MKKRRFWIPNTLRHRLFVAYVVLLLLPYSMLSVYHFREIEHAMRSNISQQDKQNLESVKRSLDNVMGFMTKTATLLEQDATVQSLLMYPDLFDDFERGRKLDSKFSSIINSFFLSEAEVYFTVADLHHHVYKSYIPLQYEPGKEQAWIAKHEQSGQKFQWISADPNYVSRDISRSPSLVSFISTLSDEQFRPVGYARISIDYDPWFKSFTSSAKESGQTYFIVDEKGTVLGRSDPGSELPAAVTGKLAEANPAESLSARDDSNSLYNFSYIPALHWYVVKQAPLDVLYREVNQEKQRFYIVISAFSLAFLFFTFVITGAFTRPLKLLQKKMETAAAKELQVTLSEQRGAEEIVALSASFNRMLRDMNGLIGRLKEEERQRQVVRFQVLLSQMDPHFLLNTLNTIKCIALKNDDEETHDLCVSLGKLLERSLNLEVDMIYLEDEIEMVRAYMQIQNARYGNLFTIEYDYEHALRYALVPKATLQPLVENSIYHGFSARREGHIIMRIYTSADQLVMEIEDDGAGLGPKTPASRRRKGIGLQNIRERLEILFQQRAGLELIALEHGVLARLRIPLLLSTPYGKEGYVDVVNVNRGG
ncbi:cache domain-containing sensor histidine kinase [Paenibacillus beijingensis]|uniref:HAMP domain-containing protein n=1 Tax=Paenibacillus beijingensis TaxID=1126833 RepID=A0A0D5NMW3_9BACL|nr:sensor histidine kinase [Paenibacillus beijingensis]AJY76510.1 hypothetical protein VN24_20505 [Paenibacillus beijingensis]